MESADQVEQSLRIKRRADHDADAADVGGRFEGELAAVADLEVECGAAGDERQQRETRLLAPLRGGWRKRDAELTERRRRQSFREQRQTQFRQRCARTQRCLHRCGLRVHSAGQPRRAHYAGQPAERLRRVERRVPAVNVVDDAARFLEELSEAIPVDQSGRLSGCGGGLVFDQPEQVQHFVRVGTLCGDVIEDQKIGEPSRQVRDVGHRAGGALQL